MVALVILAIFLAYLAVAAAATTATVRLVRRKGLSRGKRWLSGGVVALAFFLVPFWDLVPTLIAHKYYCEKEAGFWIYKTVEQWRKENPGVAETLTWSNQESPTVDSKTGTLVVRLNERVVERLAHHRLPFLPITKSEYSLVDFKSKELIAKQVIVSSGYGNMMLSSDWRSLKFWLHLDPCFGRDIKGMQAFNPVRESFKRIGVQR